MSQKKCVKHVFISHLIKTLQMSVSKDELALQPNTGRLHEETEQYTNTVAPRFNVLQDSSSQAFSSMIASVSSRNSYEARNGIPMKNRHSQGPKVSSLESEVGRNNITTLKVSISYSFCIICYCFLQGFNFLSHSTSVGGPNHKPSAPYLHSAAQQQIMSMSLPTSKTYYSHSYPDQLSGLTASHQVLKAGLPFFPINAVNDSAVGQLCSSW